MRILIVEDGLGSYILPAVRSLGAAGFTVGLAGPRRSRAASSRWVHRLHRVPPAEAGLPAFEDGVRAALVEGGYDVVFGGDDVEVLALSAARESLPAVVPYAPHPSLVRSIDKLELARAARRAGLAAPRTEPADVTLPHGMDLPVVVKARLHWTPGADNDSGRLPARLCATGEEVESALAHVRAAGGQAVAQQVVDGELAAVTVLCTAGGKVVAESHQRASRVSPALRTSTRAQTVAVDEELSQAVGRLLADLGWFGIANLQFLHPRGGVPQLIDFNGRFYGSLVLTSAAGLDLPAAWARLATGQDSGAGPVTRARPGVRYQALEEDVRRARAERRGGSLVDLAGTLAYATTAAHSTWDRSDPRPAVSRLVELAGRRGERLAARFTAVSDEY